MDPRRLLGALRAYPGTPLGRSRGAPGTLRDAPGTTLKRPGRPEVDFELILGAAAPPGSDFWSILGSILAAFSDCFGKRTASEFGPIFASGGRITKTDQQFGWLAGCPDGLPEYLTDSSPRCVAKSSTMQQTCARTRTLLQAFLPRMRARPQND